ncbi:MAG TPA: ATP-binding protein [Thermosynechococcaceae cyanobacterium]
MKDRQLGATLIASNSNSGGAQSPLEVVPASVSQALRVAPQEIVPFNPLLDRAFLKGLQRFSHLLTGSEQGSLLAEIAPLLGEIFQVDGCIIVLALPTAPRAEPPRAELWGWLQASGCCQQFSIPHPEFTSWNLAESIAIADTTILSSALPSALQVWAAVGLAADAVRSVLALTIAVQGRVVGTVSLMRSQVHHWTEAEVEGLRIMANQLAIAGQLQTQQAAQQVLEQRARHQAIVNQLTLALQNSSSLSDILQLATTGSAQAFQVKRVLLLRLKYWEPLLRSRSPGEIPRAKATVVCEWLDDGQEMPSALEQSFWIADCALSQQAFLRAQFAQTPLQPATVDSEIGAAPVFKLDRWSSLLIQPLESHGTVLGFLVLQHDEPREWQPEEIELAKLVSAQSSTAIVQTETLKQVQALVEKRTAELQQSLTVQAKLYERTRQQIDQLRHLNQLKDEFLSTISHELRTPLTSMTMAIRMLRQIGLKHDRGDRYLDILEQQCAQETKLINDLLALQELELKQAVMQLEEIDLKEMVKELTAAFETQWAAKGLSVELKLPRSAVRLQTDRDSLKRVLLELLTNAGKYSDPNTTLSLQITYRPAPAHEIVLALHNIGVGIAAEELPHIFDKFRRTPVANQNAVQGTGLGLALVNSLVQNLSGSIAASSRQISATSSYATCFTLTLPQIPSPACA